MIQAIRAGKRRHEPIINILIPSLSENIEGTMNKKIPIKPKIRKKNQIARIAPFLLFLAFLISTPMSLGLRNSFLGRSVTVLPPSLSLPFPLPHLFFIDYVVYS